MITDPWCHEGINCRQNKVNGRFLAATLACTVASQHGHIVALFQQQRRHDANAFIQTGNLDVAVIGFWQVFPQFPVRFQLVLHGIGLGHADQRAICANRHAEVATLAGFRVYRD